MELLLLVISLQQQVYAVCGVDFIIFHFFRKCRKLFLFILLQKIKVTSGLNNNLLVIVKLLVTVTINSDYPPFGNSYYATLQIIL